MVLVMFVMGLCLGGSLVLGGLLFVIVVSQRHSRSTAAQAPPAYDRFVAHYQHTVDSCEQAFTQTLKRTFKQGE